MRYYIDCSYEEHNEAKELGAKWDAAQRKWYFTNIEDADKFSRWLPNGLDIKIYTEDFLSLSAICKSLKISRSEVKRWLIKNGYIIDVYTATDKGKELGIEERQKRTGGTKLLYNTKAQEYIKSNASVFSLTESTITRVTRVSSIEDEYQTPNLEYMDFNKLGLNYSDYLIIDTETTGLKENDEVAELAILDFYGNELYHSLYEPQKDVFWAAAKKTGLSKRKLAGFPKFVDEWKRIVETVNGKKLIAHNAEFDCRLIMQTLDRYGLNKLEGKVLFDGCVDSMELAKKNVHSSSYSLESLCKKFGIVDEQKHRATYDCLMLLKFLRALEISKSDTNAKDQQKIQNDKKNIGGRAERKQLTEKYIKNGVKIEDIASDFGFSRNTIEKYVQELIEEGRLEYDLFLDPGKEECILEIVSSLEGWDGTLTSIKERVDDSISYFDIRLAISKNSLGKKKG